MIPHDLTPKIDPTIPIPDGSIWGKKNIYLHINMNFTRLNPCVKYSDLQKFSLFLGHPFSFLLMVQKTRAITIESHGFRKTMEIIWIHSHRYKLKHQLPTSQPVVSSANLKRQIREQCFYQPPVALGWELACEVNLHYGDLVDSSNLASIMAKVRLLVDTF